jgi:hypothetical protein
MFAIMYVLNLYWRNLLGASALVILLVISSGFGLGQISDFPRQAPEGAVLTDPIARLQRAMELGEVELEFDNSRGYLDSLLAALEIPVSSQTLVFSKTSFQAPLISPDAPRALYFNDDVYVGWVRGGVVLEIASVDPQYGTIFYTIDQAPEAPLVFRREGFQCVSCHLPALSAVPIPRLMMLSVLPNVEGLPVGVTSLMATTDESPLGSRWGGWYVTGASADELHRGNMVVERGRGPKWEPGAELNLQSVSDRFDVSPYLSDQSDVVALMLLNHQTETHNRIGEAAYTVRSLQSGDAVSLSDLSPREFRRLREAVEPMVRSLLFVDAAPLEAPIGINSELAREFPSRGPRDGDGRSLRDLDLNTRLLRYPLSYLVYSDSFDQLPLLAREYAYQRFQEVFEGTETLEDFSHLSSGDRRALLEILIDTKPSFRTWMESD